MQKYMSFKSTSLTSNTQNTPSSRILVILDRKNIESICLSQYLSTKGIDNRIITEHLLRPSDIEELNYDIVYVPPRLEKVDILKPLPLHPVKINKPTDRLPDFQPLESWYSFSEGLLYMMKLKPSQRLIDCLKDIYRKTLVYT